MGTRLNAIFCLAILAGCAGASLVLLDQDMNGVAVELNKTAGYNTLLRFGNYTLSTAVFSGEYVLLNGTYLAIKPANPADRVTATVLAIDANKTIYATCAGDVDWIIGGFSASVPILVYENGTIVNNTVSNGTGYITYANTPAGWYSFAEGTTTTTNPPSGGGGGHPRATTTTTPTTTTTQPTSPTQPGATTTQTTLANFPNPSSTSSSVTTSTLHTSSTTVITGTTATVPVTATTATTIRPTATTAPGNLATIVNLSEGETMRVRVSGPDGKPYVGEVQIRGPNGEVFTQITDAQGYVNVTGQSAGEWTVTPVGGLGSSGIGYAPILAVLAVLLLIAILLTRRRKAKPTDV